MSSTAAPFRGVTTGTSPSSRTLSASSSPAPPPSAPCSSTSPTPPPLGSTGPSSTVSPTPPTSSPRTPSSKGTAPPSSLPRNSGPPTAFWARYRTPIPPGRQGPSRLVRRRVQAGPAPDRRPVRGPRDRHRRRLRRLPRGCSRQQSPRHHVPRWSHFLQARVHRAVPAGRPRRAGGREPPLSRRDRATLPPLRTPTASPTSRTATSFTATTPSPWVTCTFARTPPRGSSTTRPLPGPGSRSRGTAATPPGPAPPPSPECTIRVFASRRTAETIRRPTQSHSTIPRAGFPDGSRWSLRPCRVTTRDHFYALCAAQKRRTVTRHHERRHVLISAPPRSSSSTPAPPNTSIPTRPTSSPLDAPAAGRARRPPNRRPRVPREALRSPWTGLQTSRSSS
mmetsp:Transcript_18931/g.60473  ORF Transcript_18931/g.60473 Transcript_18931/m.60473 type:complete len:394 (+) Transcript_18931:1005-2186(+)